MELLERIEKSSFEGRTLTLKVKYSDFTQITRSISQEKILKKKADILPLAKRLLQQVDYSSAHPIRLLGLSVSNAAASSAASVEGAEEGAEDVVGSVGFKKENRMNSSRKPEYRELELEFEEWES